MENRIWLKPSVRQGKEDVFKERILENASETSLSLEECIYFDTKDMDLFKHNGALLLCCGKGISQKCIFIKEGADFACDENVKLVTGSLDVSLFSEKTAAKIKEIIAGKPLLIQCAVTLTIKTAKVPSEGEEAVTVSRTVGRFEDDDISGELYTVGIESEDNAALLALADKLAAEEKLIECPPPQFEAMRIKASGFRPAIPYKKIRKAEGISPAAQIYSLRLMELLRVHERIMASGMEKENVHRLRVELRRTISLIEAFSAAMEDTAPIHISNLEDMLSRTDELRTIDVLLERLAEITAEYPNMDFSILQHSLENGREDAAALLETVYKNGVFTEPFITLWLEVHAKNELWQNADTEEAIRQELYTRLKNWAGSVAALKKTSFNDAETIHDSRIIIKKLRYTLEADEALPKQVREVSAHLKKLQDVFGMVSDAYENIKALSDLAVSSENGAFSYTCGVVAGIFSVAMQNASRDVYALWKEHRASIGKITETL